MSRNNTETTNTPPATTSPGADSTPAENSSHQQSPPGWVTGASQRRAFVRGLLAPPLVPGAILFSAMIGFGALARDTGLTVGQALFVTATVFQLPGQVAMVDGLARGAALGTVAFAVLLTAIRLTPMTVVLMPLLRGSGLPQWMLFAGSHFVAISAWVESMRRLPAIPTKLRLPHYLGYALSLYSCTIVATYIGYELAGEVPANIGAILLFLTPIYFVLSLLGTSTTAADYLAIVLGIAIGPILFLLTPGLDLLLTGLIGGTAAYAIGRHRRSGS